MHIGKMTNFEFLVLVSSHSDSTDYSISGKEFLQSSLQSGFLIAETFLIKPLKQYNLFQKNLIRKKKIQHVRHKRSFQIDFLVVEVRLSVELLSPSHPLAGNR